MQTNPKYEFKLLVFNINTVIMKIKDLPKEIKEVALREQFRAGNERNESIHLSNNAYCEGFDWDKSVDGRDFWLDINDRDFDVFYERYPKEKNTNGMKNLSFGIILGTNASLLRYIDICKKYGLPFNKNWLGVSSKPYGVINGKSCGGGATSFLKVKIFTGEDRFKELEKYLKEFFNNKQNNNVTENKNSKATNEPINRRRSEGGSEVSIGGCSEGFGRSYFKRKPRSVKIGERKRSEGEGLCFRGRVGRTIEI